MRAVFSAAFICLAFMSPGNAIQVPDNLEQCLPIPTLAQEIQQRNADAQSQEKHVKLDTLSLEGNTALAPDELSAIARSLTSRTYDDDPTWIRELQERIQDEWQHRGFFRAHVEGPRAVLQAETSSERRFAVKAVIDAGKVYRLDRIDFLHNSQFSSGELRAMFPIQDGDTFDTHQFQRGLENVRKAYGTKGFINFSVLPAFSIDDKNALIPVALEIEEGKRYSFGRIEILGLEPPLAQRLLRESGIETGAVFDVSLWDKFLEQNKTLLPHDAAPESDTLRRLDEQQGTVDVTIDFRRCPIVAQH